MNKPIFLLFLILSSCAQPERKVRCQPYFKDCDGSRPECQGYWDIDRNYNVEIYQCTEIILNYKKD